MGRFWGAFGGAFFQAIWPKPLPILNPRKTKLPNSFLRTKGDTFRLKSVTDCRPTYFTAVIGDRYFAPPAFFNAAIPSFHVSRGTVLKL